MKKLLLSGVFAAMAFGGWADVVTPNQALDRVMGNAGLMSAGMQQSRPQLVATRSVDNQPAVYVFSLDSGKGYIVLPADDEATPMLGYSDSGKFDAAAINPTMQWWLDEYGPRSNGCAKIPPPTAICRLRPRPGRPSLRWSRLSGIRANLSIICVLPT